MKTVRYIENLSDPLEKFANISVVLLQEDEEEVFEYIENSDSGRYNILDTISRIGESEYTHD